uniref:Uncharacterized protein LOC105131887 n=1 Tax=Rhizophora mucronata TaxID=61149 RepID=A0A2P2K9W8_RHIMU
MVTKGIQQHEMIRVLQYAWLVNPHFLDASDSLSKSWLTNCHHLNHETGRNHLAWLC